MEVKKSVFVVSDQDHINWPVQSRSLNFVFKKKGDCTAHEAKTKVLISCAATAQLLCVFVLAFTKKGFLMVRLIYVGKQ